MADECKIRDWASCHFSQKWSWAGHVARRPCDAWTWRVTTWRDSDWQHLAQEMGTSRPLRPPTRRWMKWEDALRRYCSEKELGEWTFLAGNREEWHSRANDFTTWAFRALVMSRD